MEQILDILINLFTYEFGPPGTQVALAPLAIAGIAMAGSQVLSGGISAILGGKAKRDAERRQRALMSQIQNLENSRQQIINPFAGASSILTNPFANMPVATQAAEFQAQQTDLSLASTLDTLRATGAGAGGATALAQAALQAKQGVSASIAQQEAQNARLAAQGQARLETQLAQAEAKGKQFVFGAQEKREMQKLNRLSAMAGAASQQAAAAESAQLAGIGQAVGGIGSLASMGLSGGFNNPAATTTNTATSVIPQGGLQQNLTPMVNMNPGAVSLPPLPLLPNSLTPGTTTSGFIPGSYLPPNFYNQNEQ